MKGALSVAFVVSAFLSLANGQAGNYQQCGGSGWTGATTCNPGWTCTKLNDFYFQCLPGATGTTSSTSSTSSTRSLTSSTSISSTSATGTTVSSSSTTAGPSPTSTLSAQWQAAYTKAKAAVARLSLSEKVSLGTGTMWMKGKCVGNLAAIPSIGFPSLCLQDGPASIRFAPLVTVWPAGINAAATWNRNLIRQRGTAFGAEHKAKGVHVALGPAVNLARAPDAGRNWEGFGGDPYLSGEAAYETIKGMQGSGVQACVKHYINNEQEHNRETSSSNVDERTQHELYALPFLRAVQAEATAVMCSYNKINGVQACESDYVLNKLLKTEFGFPGYVMTDWWAKMSNKGSVLAGLDMAMPGDTSYGSGQSNFGQGLVNLVNSGEVPASRVDDLATRVLAGWYLLGQDSGYPSTNFDSWTPGNSQQIDVRGDHGTLARTIAAKSTVLLKNNKNLLPLAKPASIAVIGSHAAPNPQGINSCTDRGCNTGVLAIGWGSGTGEFTYLIDPLSALRTKAQADGTSFTSSTSDTDLTAAANAARGKSAALVFITADSGEEYITVENNKGDRNDLKAWHNGDNLVAAVAGANANTIVVVNSVGQINMEAWVNHANVTAIVWAGLPGQEAGNALVDVLYGAVNPSGRLPYTIARSDSDYSARVDQGASTITYSEGLYIDYRHFDKNKIAPRYEFGFGLSYTTFAYASLSVSGSIGTGSAPSGPGTSVSPWLHEKVITVTFSLSNTGSRAGTEIAQLYITPPASANSPPYLLKGFEAVDLGAGQAKTVTIQLSRFDFAIWSVAQQKFVVPTGTHGIAIGASSRDLRLTGSLTV